MANKLTFLSQLSSHFEKIRNKRRGYILCGGWELMAHHADAEDAGNTTGPARLVSFGARLVAGPLLTAVMPTPISEADPEPGALHLVA
jgi:hypothetical protein